MFWLLSTIRHFPSLSKVPVYSTLCNSICFNLSKEVKSWRVLRSYRITWWTYRFSLRFPRHERSKNGTLGRRLLVEFHRRKTPCVKPFHDQSSCTSYLYLLVRSILFSLLPFFTLLLSCRNLRSFLLNLEINIHYLQNHHPYCTSLSGKSFWRDQRFTSLFTSPSHVPQYSTDLSTLLPTTLVLWSLPLLFGVSPS